MDAPEKIARDNAGDGTPPRARSDLVVTEGFKNLSATFKDRETEAAYGRFLAGPASDREVLLQVLGIISYLSYGVLDLFVTGDLALEFVTLRFLIVLPTVSAVVALTAHRKFRALVEWSTTFGFTAMSLSIVYMIYKMPAAGGPPYIIGLLIVMIFTSCLMRVRFLIAAPTCILIAAVYCIILVTRLGAPSAEVISGYFFMLSVAAVAAVTNYIQERRARETWLRNAQREHDAIRIEQLLIEATAADRSKINFLSLLTHELRTPLHQIIGFSEVSRGQIGERMGDELAAPLDQITASARDLLKKLGQMLRYADATAGKLDFCIDEIPASEIIDLLIDQSGQAAAARSVRIDASHIEPAILVIDAHHTSLALSSLIENSINASGPGTTIRVEGALAGQGRYKLKIIDEGGGMSPEKLAAALAPFEQTESGKARSREGLGLGLPIARFILAGQGASFDLDSKAGGGTTATIIFKASVPQISGNHNGIACSA